MKAILLLALSLMTTNALAVTQLTNQAEVAAAFAKKRPMVIMFSTEWCGFCKTTKPEYEKAEKELAGKVDFYLVDSDKLQIKMAKDFDGIPAFVAGRNEKEIRSAKSLIMGGMSAAGIVDYVKKNTN